MFRLWQHRALPAAAACLVFAGVCAAQTKVGVINLQKSVVDTAEITKAQKEMEAKYKPRQEQMEKLQKDIAAIQNQLQTLQGKLNAQGEAELNTQGTRKQRELQRLSEDLQGDVDRERNEILSRSSQRMQEVVRKMAEERGLDLVVDVGSTFYFKAALDITKDATAAYDKAYPPK